MAYICIKKTFHDGRLYQPGMVLASGKPTKHFEESVKAKAPAKLVEKKEEEPEKKGRKAK